MHDDFEIGVAASELARYARERGNAKEDMQLAREGLQAAAQSGDHLHQALAAAIEAQAAERLGHRTVADRQFRSALTMLAERNAGGKLAEVCVMYADLLRGRGENDRAFAFLGMAAERDFTRLPVLLRR